MKKSKWFKWLKIILLAILAISVYMSIGHYINYEISKATYYQKSWQAKILLPVAPVWGMPSPFFKATPDIDQKLQNKHVTFENFYKSKSTSIMIILWPFACVLIYVICIVTWLLWLTIKLWALLCIIAGSFWWLITGGPGKAIIGQ